MKKKSLENPKNIKVLKRLSPYIFKRKQLLLGVFVSLCLAAFSVLAMGWGIRQLIDAGFLKNQHLYLNQAIIGIFAIAVLLALSSYMRATLVAKFCEGIITDIRKEAFEKLISFRAFFFETHKTGDIISRINTDTTLLSSLIGSTGSMTLRNILLVTGGLIMLGFTSPELTIYVLVTIPVIVIPVILFAKKLRKASKNEQDNLSQLSSFMEERLNGIRTIQAFSNEKVIKKAFFDLSDQSFQSSMDRTYARGSLTVALIILVFSAISGLLWFGGKSVIEGTLTPGELTAFIFYAIVVAASTGSISDIVSQIQRAAGTIEQLFSLIDQKDFLFDQPNEQMDSHKDHTIKGNIAFKNVSFFYPSRPDHQILEGFNFDIKSGEKIAIVGPSGAGKTTIFDLLLRFYDIQKGDILIDDIQLPHLSHQKMRESIALVPQDPIIFSGNAWDNISLGDPSFSQEQIKKAAEKAAALEFIDKLPEGFDTFLGEKGIRLSGGQKQRIAIARAFLKNPKILLLDEATNALDAESERYIQQSIDAISQKRTTLIIAHRLSTVIKMERIIVMNNGQFIAEGNHQSLLKDCPLYARLAKLQLLPHKESKLEIAS